MKMPPVPRAHRIATFESLPLLRRIAPPYSGSTGLCRIFFQKTQTGSERGKSLPFPSLPPFPSSSTEGRKRDRARERGMATEDEKLLKEAKKLPWDERLLHKNWKVRNDANIDLAAFCDSISDPKDPRLRDFGPLFKKTVADSNAPVQEKALDALIAFLKAADADAGRYAKEVCDAIVAKCLTGRPKTVEKAQAAFLLWVELEAADVFLNSRIYRIEGRFRAGPCFEELTPFVKYSIGLVGGFILRELDFIRSSGVQCDGNGAASKIWDENGSYSTLYTVVRVPGSSWKITDSMEKAIKNKVAKAVVPAIDVMFQALSDFGSKIVPPKRILKMLPELFDHQDQNVRASSKGLTLELCRWIGKDPVKSILFEKMRDTMKKELEAELVNVTGTARPTRKIRSEQDKEPEQESVSEAIGPGPSDESASDVPQEIDEYELVDPVEILTPLEKSGFWDGVKATKWSERRDAVAELTKLASTKRIAPGDFSEICRALKKLITDVNIAVSVEAIQAIGNLARGLRNHFSASSRFLLPVLLVSTSSDIFTYKFTFCTRFLGTIYDLPFLEAKGFPVVDSKLEKLKEKKPTLAESLTQTLQAMHKSGCLTLPDVIEGKFPFDS
ncbi:Protein MICROTUBULE ORGANIZATION 1 [Asimina triloba]